MKLRYLSKSLNLHSRVRISAILSYETAFLLLYNCKQHELLLQQQIFRTPNQVCSNQQSVLIFTIKQLELINYKLKIPNLNTLILKEQYLFVLSHIKIYSVPFKRSYSTVIDRLKWNYSRSSSFDENKFCLWLFTVILLAYFLLFYLSITWGLPTVAQFHRLWQI